MSRLFIFCEGYVEQENVKNFLRPFWQKRFDDVEPPRRYSGAYDLRNNFKRDAEILLKNKDWYVLCLLDLYEEPFKICKPHMSHAEQFTLVQRYMYEQINPQYHAHFAAIPVVMEIETWILADPVIQKSHLRLNDLISSPEEIEHPYAELKRLFGGAYDKRIHGTKLFRLASAQRVYDDNCPHFKQLVDWLVNPSALFVSDKQKELDQDIQRQYEQRLAVVQDLRRRLETQQITDHVADLLNQLTAAQKSLDAFQKQHSKTLNLKR